MWATPLEGLRAGGSVQAMKLDIDYSLSPATLGYLQKQGTVPATFGGTFKYKLPVFLWVASLEYAAHDLLLGIDDRGKITELGLWSVLAIEQQRWRRVKDGPAAGLATVRVRPAYEGAVMDWCERDSIHEGTTRRIELDCLDCGACCHEANVLLDLADFDRWRKAGRRDLLDKAYMKRKDGKVTLRFLADGRCRNLGPPPHRPPAESRRRR